MLQYQGAGHCDRRHRPCQCKRCYYRRLSGTSEIDDALTHGNIQLAGGVGINYGVTPDIVLKSLLGESSRDSGHLERVSYLALASRENKKRLATQSHLALYGV